jgi:hypothetical protein
MNLRIRSPWRAHLQSPGRLGCRGRAAAGSSGTRTGAARGRDPALVSAPGLLLTAASLLLLATLAALRISTTRHSRNRVRLFPLLLGSLVIRGTQFIPTRRKLRLGLVQAWHSAQLPSGLFFSISQALVSVGNIQHFLLGLMLA